MFQPILLTTGEAIFLVTVNKYLRGAGCRALCYLTYHCRQVFKLGCSNLLLKIGSETIEPGLVLAPMAGITSQPFRILAREQGCRLVISEMISAKGLMYKNDRNCSLLYFTEEEKPLGLQIFGSEPDILASAAARLENMNPDFIDLNMGCPTRKVIKNGDGGALLRDPVLCSKIFQAVTKAVSCPVTVKLRKGWDEKAVTAPEIASRAEAAGIAAITVHGRTVAQGYSGKADWDIIARVKESVRIPVIGNGDIVSAADALAMIDKCSCDGVMIGRAARGNPWIFAEVLAAIQGRPLPPKPTGREIIDMMLRHFKLLEQLKGEKVASREMRRHSSWYIKGLSGAASARQKLIRAKSFVETEEILDELFINRGKA